MCLGDCPPGTSRIPMPTEGHERNEQGGPMQSEVPEEAPDPNPYPETPFEDIFAPLMTEGTDSERLRARGDLGEGPMVPLGEMRGRPDLQEGGRVPLDDAMPAYHEAYESAIRSGAVPPEYRDSVRRYFDELRQP